MKPKEAAKDVEGQAVYNVGRAQLLTRSVDVNRVVESRGGLADCPAVSFRFVYLHSRRWEPSISGGTFETVLQRQK